METRHTSLDDGEYYSVNFNNDIENNSNQTSTNSTLNSDFNFNGNTNNIGNINTSLRLSSNNPPNNNASSTSLLNSITNGFQIPPAISDIFGIGNENENNNADNNSQSTSNSSDSENINIESTIEVSNDDPDRTQNQNTERAPSNDANTIEFQVALKWLQNNLIFLLLLFMIFIYKYKQGILGYVWLFSVLYHGTIHLDKQLSVGEHRKVSILLLLSVAIIAHIVFMFQYFKDQHLSLPYYGNFEKLTVMSVIWIVMMNDVLIRYFVLLARCIVAIFYSNGKKRKNIFTFIYQLSSFLRTYLPMRLWSLYFYSLSKEEDGGVLFAIGLEIIYIFLKLRNVKSKLTTLKLAFDTALLKGHLSFGDYATPEQLVDDPTCPICQDTLKNPVVLKSCSHLYCLHCITEWFDKDERTTCPICRTVCTTAIGFNKSDQLIVFF